MKALSIRQPWAELIVRGLRNEHRTTLTKIRGRVYIYACKAPGASSKEMAKINEEFGTDLDLKSLARGVLIGTVEIVDCKEIGYADYEWVMNAPPGNLHTTPGNREGLSRSCQLTCTSRLAS